MSSRKSSTASTASTSSRSSRRTRAVSPSPSRSASRSRARSTSRARPTAKAAAAAAVEDAAPRRRAAKSPARKASVSKSPARPAAKASTKDKPAAAPATAKKSSAKAAPAAAKGSRKAAASPAPVRGRRSTARAAAVSSSDSEEEEEEEEKPKAKGKTAAKSSSKGKSPAPAKKSTAKKSKRAEEEDSESEEEKTVVAPRIVRTRSRSRARATAAIAAAAAAAGGLASAVGSPARSKADDVLQAIAAVSRSPSAASGTLRARSSRSAAASSAGDKAVIGSSEDDEDDEEEEEEERGVLGEKEPSFAFTCSTLLWFSLAVTLSFIAHLVALLSTSPAARRIFAHCAAPLPAALVARASSSSLSALEITAISAVLHVFATFALKHGAALANPGPRSRLAQRVAVVVGRAIAGVFAVGIYVHFWRHGDVGAQAASVAAALFPFVLGFAVQDFVANWPLSSAPGKVETLVTVAALAYLTFFAPAGHASAPAKAAAAVSAAVGAAGKGASAAATAAATAAVGAGVSTAVRAAVPVFVIRAIQNALLGVVTVGGFATTNKTAFGRIVTASVIGLGWIYLFIAATSFVYMAYVDFVVNGATVLASPVSTLSAGCALALHAVLTVLGYTDGFFLGC